MPMPPTPESEAIDAMRVAVMVKLDEIVALLTTYVALLTTYVADVAASHAAAATAAAEAEAAAAAAALLDTASHTDRTAVATEAMAHKPSGTANAHYHQRQKD